MDKLSVNLRAFLSLVQAGLWEKSVWLESLNKDCFTKISRIAEEQSVVGLVAAGLEHVNGLLLPHDCVLQIIGQALQLEQRNIEMNNFIGAFFDNMRSVGIYPVLIKGQGVAQCYERPLWRTSGDVDILLSNEHYQKAITFLKPLAVSIDEENLFTRHLALSIENWEVELHGTMRTGLWKRFDKVLDDVQDELFSSGKVRSWMNGNTQVCLPGVDEDVVYIFAHILQHFYKEGIGLRQICDWCRLLWTYRESLDHRLLEFRIRKMGVMTEWKAFACFAVCYLGMPIEAMPFYIDSSSWQKKADRILSYILMTGNFGHNRDLSFRQSNSVVERKTKMFWHITMDAARQFAIFPLDSIKMWSVMMKTGGLLLMKGKKHE